MLWELKRTVSTRRYFCAPKTHVYNARKKRQSQFWFDYQDICIQYFSGPSNDLEAYILGEVNCKGINVGTLLRNITDPNLRAWGMELAEHLLRADAPMKEMGRAFNKPTLHVAIRVTLQTGKH